MTTADASFLSGIPIFGGLPAETLSRIAGLVRVRQVEAGAVIMEEGTPAREMFIVREGELEVRKKNSRGADIRVATLRKGDCVGEMSLIDIQPRSATVRTLGPGKLLVLTQQDLAEIERGDSRAWTLLVMNIAREISRRLRRVDEVLVELALPVQDLWGHE